MISLYMKRIYLDYAATTPLKPAVTQAMRPYFRKKFGNPGSLHTEGRVALGALDEARAETAALTGVDFSGVVFTSGATEANNLAIRGILKSWRQTTDNQQPEKPKIITTAVEHSSILNTVRDLVAEGKIEAVHLPVSRDGEVDLKTLAAALDEKTVLVSVMLANNETGNIYPLAEIAEIIKKFKHSLNPKSQILYPLLHTDAVQASNFYDSNIGKIGADLMTLSAHKIYGPKGTGALILNNSRWPLATSKKNKKSLIPGGYPPVAIQTGSGQEFGRRSGTENVPGAVGFATALSLAVRDREKFSRRLQPLKEKLWRGIKKTLPDARVNGMAVAPHILNVYFPGFFASDILTALDLAGVSVSAGSACATGRAEPSHVLQALGHDSERVGSSLRFSLGWETTTGDIEIVLKKISRTLSR